MPFVNRSLLFAVPFLIWWLLAGAMPGCTTAEIKDIQIEEAWARPTTVITGHEEHEGSKTTSAVYLTILNKSAAPERLMGARTNRALSVEMHQTIIDENQVMRMRKVEDLPISPRDTVRFEPGSYHLMLIGLEESLEAGGGFELELQFEQAGVIIVPVLVRED